MAGDETYWSADVPVSMPLPPEQPARLSMSGFTFTDGGLAHDITQADYERLSVPDFAPENPSAEMVYEDTDVDAPFSSEEVF